MQLTLLTRPVSLHEYSAIDARSSAVYFSPSALENASAALLERVQHRSALVIAACRANVPPDSFAFGMFADVFLVEEGSQLDLGRGTEWWGLISAAVLRRIGERSSGLLLTGPRKLSADETWNGGLCEAVVACGSDSLQWAQQWLSGRSVPALQSAAALLRRRGGDAIERAEFGRLFATGEPQLGLKRFLNRDATDFSQSLMVEML